MKKTLLLTLIFALVSLMIAGCGTTYTVKGEVVSAECSGSSSGIIKLDNGVTYSGGRYGCKVEEGSKVTITHDDRFRIAELIVDGTTKNGNNDKDATQ